MRQSAVILLSGGVDSTTLLHYVRKRLEVAELYALSVSYGQKHSRELEAAKIQARAVDGVEHHVMDISDFTELTRGGSALTDAATEVPDLAAVAGADRDQPPTYVPNRNMVLLSLACAFAETRGVADVYYGAQAQDEYGYWDCTREFVDRLNAALALNRRRPIRVHAPFVDRRKADIVRLGLELGVDFEATWTCYRGGETPCGTCPSCVERKNAFAEAGGRIDD